MKSRPGPRQLHRFELRSVESDPCPATTPTERLRFGSFKPHAITGNSVNLICADAPRLRRACGILEEVLHAVLVNEEVGLSFSSDPDDVLIVVLDPSSNFFAVNQLHDDRGLAFRKPVDIFRLAESRFRRGLSTIPSAGEFMRCTYCHAESIQAAMLRFSSVKIEALLFDLGKVIIDFNFELGMQRLAANCGLSRVEFEQVIWSKNWIRRYERGEISTADYHKYLCETGRLQMELEEFRESWSSVFLPD